MHTAAAASAFLARYQSASVTQSESPDPDADAASGILYYVLRAGSSIVAICTETIIILWNFKLVIM